MRRSLVLGLLSASLLACSGAPPRPPESATDRARRDGPTSTDGEVVGRWLLGELLAPGGTPAEAAKARKRLGEVGDKGMYGSLARAVDDASHGKIPAAARAYMDTLRAARGSGDPAAPVVSWYATNHLLALDGAVPDLWKEAKPWVTESLEAPGSLGWRARSELVEWWSRHAFEEAEANLLDRAATQYGCAREIRLAGPFGHNVSSDRWRSFPAEAPGPWPQRWAPDPQRAATPHVLKVERQGCTVRTDEPTAPGIFYAEATLDAPAAREVIIAVQGALAVWIDDHPVLVRDPRKWGVWPKFGVQVRLEEGRHRVVARLAEPDTSMRVLKVDGTPALDVKTLPSGASTYTSKKPEQPADPNVLDAFITPPARAHKKSEETPPDATLSFLAAHLAGIEGQYDVASVLLEPLHADQEKATALALATAATFAEKDPIFPETDARDLGRLLREKASGKDPQLFFPKLWLVVDKADKGMPDAARAVRAMVDEFPEVPEVLRVLSSLYARLGWRAERAQATKTLVERFPQDRGALEAAIGILEEQGKTKEADELAKRLRDLYPDSEIELDRALLRKDWKAALAELARLGKRRPDRRDIADRVASVLVRAGQQPDPVAAIERALKRNPRDGSARLSLADARFAAGDRGALRAALATALSQGAGDGELRSAIELVEGMTELEPYRIDGRAVIAEYEKDTRPLDGTAARVLDYSALWIHSDGSARMLEHELVRVQSQEAIGKLAEQRVPANALLLRMRVIKKDGTVLEPERVEGKPTITMPHLEIGDYIETENVTTQESDGEGGKRYLGPHWFFREADIAYWRSEFVVIAPKDRPLVLETTGAVPAPAVAESGPLVVRKWRVDRSPAAPVEPSSVPVQEFLPSVRVGWGLTQEGQLARMLDATVDDLPRDPRLSRIASRIAADVPKSDTREQARRLYRWIVANVEDGRETDGRRVVVGKTGSRAAGFLYLARALGLPVEVAVTRDRLRPRDEGPLSTALSFNQVVLRMSGPCRPGAQRATPTTLGDEGQTCAPPLWFTVADKYAPFGFLPAELRGQPAVRLVTGFPREVTEAGGSVDGIVYEGTADLRADGSAILEIDQRFVGRVAIGVRATVEQLPEEQLSRVVESRLLARALPGARLMSLTVVDKDDLDKPVTFRMKVEVSDFARRRGDALALKPPLTMKIAPLAALETRQTPMLLPEATHTEVRLVIKLPQGATIAAPPRAEDIKDGERLVRVADAVAQGTLRIDRTIDIPAGRVAPEEYAGFRKFTLAADEATGREVLIQVR